MINVRESVGAFTTRLAALGFALGAAAHAAGFILLTTRGIELYGAGYPAWRHAAMAAIDAAITRAAARPSRFLPIMLAAFAGEQLLVNGLNWEAGLSSAACLLILVARPLPLRVH